MLFTMLHLAPARTLLSRSRATDGTVDCSRTGADVRPRTRDVNVTLLRPTS
jgi:hypothetical protein